MVTLPFGELKRRTIKGRNFWVIENSTLTKGLLEDTLGIKIKRRSAYIPKLKRSTWVYQVFPARGDTRLKKTIVPLIQPEEVLPTPYKKPTITDYKILDNLTAQAFVDKDMSSMERLELAKEMLEQGNIEEAHGIMGEVREELEDEKFYEFEFEIRDEWRT